MNKKQFAILSVGNVLQKDEGVTLYASKYLETNYSFYPRIDIIHGGIEGMSLLNIFTQYEEIFVLDVIGIDDNDAGALYHFPMSKFRDLGTNGSAGELGVLECLNMLERRGQTLPEVNLLAIVPDIIDKGMGLSTALEHAFESYILMLVNTIEKKGFTCGIKHEKQTLDSVIKSFT